MDSRDSLSVKLKALTGFRVLFITILLGTFTLFNIGQAVFPYPDTVFKLIIFLYAATIVYLFLLGRVPGRILAYAQHIVDVFFVMMLLYLTGGIESWFSFLLIVVVISAAMVTDKRAGFVMAIVSSLLYGLMIDLQFYGVLPIPYTEALYEKDFLFNIFSLFLALFVCAYLTGYLASRLEGATTKLEKKAVDLRDLTLFNREVIENIPSGLVTTDIAGRVLLFNMAAKAITGLGSEAAIGEEIQNIFPFLKESWKTNVRMEGDIPCDGRKKTIGITISGMKNAAGALTGYIAIFQDLTQIKSMMEEIRLKEKLAAIGELSANMAHEIRNPLASLRGSIDMLQKASLSPAQRESLMNIALSEMDRLNRIITDFLTYSRPSKPVPERIDLTLLLNSSLELVGKSAPEGVAIRAGGFEPIFVTADPQMLQQIFLNLCLNAFDAMPGGGALTVSSAKNGDSAQILFKDSGGGIAAENRDKIFFPFFTTKKTGTGLGLSIAMRLAQDHGGTIHVESNPGEGSTFKLLLPLSDEPA